jgi:hypothetical protein
MCVRITAIVVALIGIVLAGMVEPARGANQAGADTSGDVPRLTTAVMCEAIRNYAPVHPAVVFSISARKVSCFTAFDAVAKETFIYHKWYHADQLSTTKRLYLKTPRWATYSSIQLREADKGPWRVEVTDRNQQVLETLRFSVTD